MPQLFNVCAKKVYEKDGEKKIKWYIAGLMKISDTGKRYLMFFHQPQTEYYVFEKEPSLPEIQVEENK
jgi:hypothetical protein